MCFTIRNESGFCAVASFLQPCSSSDCAAAQMMKDVLCLRLMDTCCECTMYLCGTRRKVQEQPIPVEAGWSVNDAMLCQ